MSIRNKNNSSNRNNDNDEINGRCNAFENCYFNVDNSAKRHVVTYNGLNPRFTQTDTPASLESSNGIIPENKTTDDSSALLSVDIDGIFGALSFENAKKVILNSITIEPNKGFKIGTKNEYVIVSGVLQNIKKFNHVQFGSIDTPYGKASLFYVCPSLDEDVHVDVLFTYCNNIQKTFERYANNKKTIVPNNDVILFLNHVIKTARETTNHSHDFFFIEMYGTKYKMVASLNNTTKQLSDMINSAFCIDYFKFLKYDIALNISFKNKICFPTVEFFKKMRIKPNYFLFLNRNFVNVNEYLVKLKENILVRRSEQFFKFNFYSTVEDLLLPIRDYTFLPKISHELLKCDLAGHQPITSVTTKNRCLAKVRKCLNDLNIDEDVSFPYRIEFRTSPFFIDEALTKVLEAVDQIEFLTYNSKTILEKVSAEANKMLLNLDNIEFKTLKTIFKATVIETFLVNTFFKGSTNLQALPQRLHERSRYTITNHRTFTLPVFQFEDWVEEVQRNEIIESFKRNIRYDHKLTEQKKELLVKILEITSMCLREAAKTVIFQYCNDLKNRYSLPSVRLPLLSLNYLSDVAFDTNHLDFLVTAQFGSSDNKKFLKLPYRAMISLYLIENNVSSELWLNAIKSYILERNFDLLYNVNNKLTRPDLYLCKFINKSGQTVNIEQFNKEYQETKRSALFNRLNNLVVIPTRQKTIKWDSQEKVRFIAAQRFYESYMRSNRKGVWAWLEKTTLFGFLFTRSANQMRDTLTRFQKSDEHFQANIQRQADVWTPSSFDTEASLENLARFRITLNDEALEIYKQLREIDLYMYNNVRGLDINEEEIFNAEPNVNQVEGEQRVNNPPMFVDLKEIKTMVMQIKETLEVMKECMINENTQGMSFKNNNTTYNFDNMNNQTFSDGIDFDCGNNDYEIKNYETNDNEFSKKNIIDKNAVKACTILLLPAPNSSHLDKKQLLVLAPHKKTLVSSFLFSLAPLVTTSITSQLLLPAPRHSVTTKTNKIKINMPIFKKTDMPIELLKHGYWRTLLLSKFRYKQFNNSVARKSCFNVKNRPSSIEWVAYINSLHEQQILHSVSNTSKKNFSRFNLICSYNPITTCSFEVIKKIANNLTIKFDTFSLKDLFDAIGFCQTNVNIDKFEEYVEDLVSDGVFKFEYLNNVKYYKI